MSLESKLARERSRKIKGKEYKSSLPIGEKGGIAMMPLDGIRVIQMEATGPVMFCALCLADLGADVIVIESATPRPRIQTPGMLPGLSDAGAEYGNRNKRSIVLNLKERRGRDILYKLVTTADVMLEANRPGVMKRLCADYDTIQKINPRIIYCSVTGYGQDGPYKNLPGHDICWQAVGGRLSMITGGVQREGKERKGPPGVPDTLLADERAATNATIGVLTALFAREKTGEGQYLDIAAMDGVICCRMPWAEGRPDLDGHYAGYNIYETADAKYVALAILEPWLWERFCKETGREDLITKQIAKGREQAEIVDVFREFFRSKTRNELLTLGKKLDIELAQVNKLDEVVLDPQVVHRAMLVQVDHPCGGKVVQPGMPIKFSKTKPVVNRRAAPFYGQHTKEIMKELGYLADEIEQLERGGVVKTKCAE